MRLSPLDLQWVLNAEFLPLAAVTLVAGALGDRFGQKRIFLAGIALYGLGATAVAFAPSFALLIVGRFLQRLDGTLILPNGHSVLGHAFSADKKARAVGIWSAAAAVAGGVARARRDRRSRVQADDLSDAPARSRRRWPCPGRRWWRIFSTVGLGGLGAGLTNRSGLNLWVLVTLIIGLGGLARPDRDRTAIRRQRHAAVPLRLADGGRRYGAFTVMLTLIPFVIIRGAHLPTPVAGLAFIPLQVLITVVSPLTGMLCRRFGRRLPLFAGGAVVALGYAMTHRVGSNATYWAHISLPHLVAPLGMSLAIAPLTTLVLTSVESDRAGAASGVNARSRAGSLFAIGQLGAVLQQGGPQLFSGFHMATAAVACVPAMLAVFVIGPGPTSTSSPETDPFGFLNQHPGEAGRKQ